MLCQTCGVPLTLPSRPKAFGTIRHVFDSSLKAILSQPNQLDLRPIRSAIVVLIDGLGIEQLQQRAGHAPFLASLINKTTISSCVFPATTSANIGSFATGLMPGEHGLVGHLVWDRHHNERINLLVGWNERTDPMVWQPHQTVAERALANSIPAYVIAAGEYEHTPYTKATMRGATFLAAESWNDRFQRGQEVVRGSGPSLSYLYVPELDKYGHKNGWSSSGYATMLEDLDAQLRSFLAKLPKDVGVIITSDHGMIETAKDRQLILDDALEKGGHLEFYGGDTRVGFVYLDDKSSLPKLVENLEPFSYAFDLVSTEEAAADGLFGEIGFEATSRLPELMLLAKSNYTLYHSKFFKPRSFEMISHHGSLTPAETRVPLFRFGF